MVNESKLKILFVEDVPSDKELAEMELRKEGFQFISEVVETENDFIKALNEFKPDVIISDYSLPSFDGMKALIIAKKLYPTIPFILYTGSMNEETAVNCIKAGAWDYVIKEHSARLPFAVKEALNIRDNKKALIKSEEKYHTIFESTGTATIIVEDDTTISMVNKECIMLTGYSSEELIGTKWTNYVAPESLDMMMKYDKIRREDPSKAPKKYEARLINKKGEIRDAILDVGFISETRQRIVSMLDITEREKAEEALLKSAKEFRILTESMPQIVWATRPDGWNIYFNQQWMDYTGMTLEKSYGHGWNKPFHPDDQQRAWDAWQNAVKNNDVYSIEARLRRFDGEYRWWLVRGIPQINERGEILKWFGTCTDIDDMKQAEEKRTKSELKYQNLIETMPEGFYRSTAEGYFIEVNPALVKMLGYDSKEELMKVHIPETLYFTQNERDDGVIYSPDFKHNTDVYRLKKKDGTEIWVEDYARYIKDSSGNILFHEGILRDVTESLRVHNEILKAKERAEEANKTKTNFLANMSHEIRTPLNGILGFAELLRTELTNPEQIEFANIIEKSGKRLLETLNLILTYAKLDAEKQEINYKYVKIENVIIETMQIFEAIAKSKNLYLKSIINEENIFTKSDERFILHILNNLVNNAIKFTNSGGITIELYRKNDKVIIKVIDTGIGIARSKQKIIFEEFRQESEGFSRSFQGTGLGLSITKRFAELVKGKIYVESEPGKGSTFIIELPYEEISGSKNIEPIKEKKIDINLKNASNKTEISILVVEDDEVNLLYIESILSNYNVVSVKNGLDAITKAKEKQFDLILMDINLGSGMNGIAATKEIRKLRNYEKTPIAALTAFVLGGDKEEFLSSGCTHYLSKPFKFKQLLELIDNMVK